MGGDVYKYIGELYMYYIIVPLHNGLNADHVPPCRQVLMTVSAGIISNSASTNPELQVYVAVDPLVWPVIVTTPFAGSVSGGQSAMVLKDNY